MFRKEVKEVDDITTLIKNTTKRLFVHDGTNNFVQQDMLVPWNSKRSTEDFLSARQFLRYYHLFVKGELAELVEDLSGCQLKHVEFEEGNWAVIFEKI